MSWVSDVWDWYIANRETAAPLLAPLGSVVVGMARSHREGERAAGKALTVSAVTRVDHVRRLSDLVAKLAARAAAGLRKSHRSPRH